MKRIVHFTTDRKHGNARNAARLKQILRRKGLALSIATAEQVHGSRGVVVPPLQRPQKFASADGLLTAAPHQPLGIFTADCFPLFLSAPSRGVVGVLHAGWRGVQGGILRKALRLLRKQWRVHPRDVFLRLGPGICRNCFEVRWDVARVFPHGRFQKKGRWFVDLASELIRQARKGGLLPRHIRRSAGCTVHERRYFSYRREHTDSRQISVICLL